MTHTRRASAINTLSLGVMRSSSEKEFLLFSCSLFSCSSITPLVPSDGVADVDGKEDMIDEGVGGGGLKGGQEAEHISREK